MSTPSRGTISSIGILGGGQLGRMLSVAAARLGLRTHIYCPDRDPIAGHVADRVTIGRYEDAEAVAEFARSVDVVTYEFENVPATAVDVVEGVVPLFPSRHALSVSQDRLIEKGFLASLGLATAPFANVEDPEGCVVADRAVGRPAILKTRRFGYDGKGQVRVDEGDVAGAWVALERVPSILEGVVDFICEISVIAARNGSGEVVVFEPGENVHRDGILRTTTVPARVGASARGAALDAARRILGALEYVGVLGVELFVTRDGGIVVNEIAPRVHNSGHWTQNGCVVDQFEQHVRAIAGWPLGDGSRIADVVMTNLIGDDVEDLGEILADPTAALHLYGKADVRPGRKMGHVNRVTPSDG